MYFLSIRPVAAINFGYYGNILEDLNFFLWWLLKLPDNLLTWTYKSFGQYILEVTTLGSIHRIPSCRKTTLLAPAQLKYSV